MSRFLIGVSALWAEGSVVGGWDFCYRTSTLGRFSLQSPKMHVCVRAGVFGARKYFMEPTVNSAQWAGGPEQLCACLPAQRHFQPHTLILYKFIRTETRNATSNWMLMERKQSLRFRLFSGNMSTRLNVYGFHWRAWNFYTNYDYLYTRHTTVEDKARHMEYLSQRVIHKRINSIWPLPVMHISTVGWKSIPSAHHDGACRCLPL